MDEEQTVFEQITWINFKKWSFTSLKARSQVWDNFRHWKLFKNDEKCFLFYLKSISRSQDIFVFNFRIFGHVEKRLD